jgi:hypothetical protein
MKEEIVTLATMAIGILATCADAQQAIDSISPASSGATTVNDLAADPSAYLGQVAVIGVVAAVKAGQGFLIGCCGSPMLPIYVSLFGSKAAGIGKPLMALISLISIGGGYLYVVRRPECNCADPETCPFPGKSNPASTRQNVSTFKRIWTRKNV